MRWKRAQGSRSNLAGTVKSDTSRSCETTNQSHREGTVMRARPSDQEAGTDPAQMQ